MIGQTISHYRILEKLGGGGMGVVYKAEDTKLKRTVALKFLPPVFSFDQEAKKRFIQEAQAASALQQHNICTIHEIDETQDGQLFIVMDYYEGQTLDDKLKKSKLRLEEFFSISTQIAEGLSWAHKIGIIHRDIKPANIFITKNGVVKILDFGLAKLTGQSMMTKMGSTVGTVAYMSPEQARGEDVDHRTDIWSIGVVMYEMLTGKPPFNSEYEQAMIYSILNEEIKPITSIKSELDTLIMDCLEKDPNERCQSAAEIRRKLKLLAGTTSSSKIKSVSQAKKVLLQTGKETRTRESFSKKWKWFAVTLIGLIVIIFSLWITQQIFKPVEIDLSKYKFTPIATDTEFEGDAAWSPDGKSIAYVKVVNGISQIFIRNIENPLPSQITFLDKEKARNLLDASPFWSPDGNLIYFISNEILYSIGLAGGEPKKILDNVSAATISPDSNTIAYWGFETINSKDSIQFRSYKSSVSIYSLTDMTKRKYIPAPFEYFDKYNPNHIQFSPDGNKIGLFIFEKDAKGAEFWVLPWPDGDNAKPGKLFESVHFAIPFEIQPLFSWMPDSRHIILSSEIQAEQGRSLLIGDIVTGKLSFVTTTVKGEYNAGSVSPDGNKIALIKGSYNYNIVRIPLDGSKPELLIATSQDEYSLSFSSAGNKSVYITNRNGIDEIWLRSKEEDIRPIITKNDYPDDENNTIVNANISPDGSHVAFRVLGNKIGSKVFVVSTEGGKPTRLLSGDNFEQISSWSPDSKFLAVAIDSKGKRTGIAVAQVGTQEQPMILPNTSDYQSWAYWSPDGKWISYFNAWGIVISSFAGKTKKVIPSPIFGSKRDIIIWSKDGSSLYIVTSSGGMLYLYKIDINSGKSRIIGENKSDLTLGTYISYGLFGCLAPDGKSIVTTAEEYKSDIWIVEGFPQP